MLRHAIPYAASGPACPCPVQTCGGIIPDPDCPDHGARTNPAMEWHSAATCAQLTEEHTVTDFSDEMPDTWVRQVVDAIEAHGHDVADAHESAIVINLTPDAMDRLDADPGEQLVIGWTERSGADWGLGRADHVPNPQPLDAATPAEIAARVHELLTTGKSA